MLSLNEKLKEVQLSYSYERPFMHCLYFICERKFYAPTHVKITQHWKSTFRVTENAANVNLCLVTKFFYVYIKILVIFIHENFLDCFHLLIVYQFWEILNLSLPFAVNVTLTERLRFTFTLNGIREFAPRGKVFPLIVVNCLLLQLKK